MPPSCSAWSVRPSPATWERSGSAGGAVRVAPQRASHTHPARRPSPEAAPCVISFPRMGVSAGRVDVDGIAWPASYLFPIRLRPSPMGSRKGQMHASAQPTFECTRQRAGACFFFSLRSVFGLGRGMGGGWMTPSIEQSRPVCIERNKNRYMTAVRAFAFVVRYFFHARNRSFERLRSPYSFP